MIDEFLPTINEEVIKTDKAPILFLDVNLGSEQGGMARIVIFEGD